jgi:hypothetical protein
MHEGLARYEVIAKPRDEGILLQWTVTSLSSEDWKDAAGNICMRNTELTDIFDPTGRCIFVRERGKWVSSADTRSHRTSKLVSASWNGRVSSDAPANQERNLRR